MPKDSSYLEEKHLMQWFELQAELAIFFMEYHFYLNDWKPWLLILRYLANSFSEINEATLTLQGEQVFIASDKIEAFKWKFRILEMLFSSLWAGLLSST